MTTCRWCLKEMEDNPGAYYHEKDCHRRDVLRRMRQENSDEEMARLEQELELASYVGD